MLQKIPVNLEKRKEYLPLVYYLDYDEDLTSIKVERWTIEKKMPGFFSTAIPLLISPQEIKYLKDKILKGSTKKDKK